MKFETGKVANMLVMFAVLLAIVIFSSCASYVYAKYDQSSIHFLASLNDTNPDVFYPIVYPSDSVFVLIPIVGADYHRIKLINNVSAVCPDEYQLHRFLSDNEVHSLKYDLSSFICTDAAERVHNDAEAVGIKCGFVRIDFGGVFATGHTINVFKQNDGKYAFVDSTPAKDGKSNARFLYVASLDHDEQMNQKLNKWFANFLKDDEPVTDYHVYW